MPRRRAEAPPNPLDPAFGGVVPEPVRPADNDVGRYAQEKLRALVAEAASRQCEALRLYEPLLLQEQFHASDAPERVLRGSNRGGKTLPAAVEVARAVTGQDPHGKWPKKDGRFFCVAKNGKLVGQVLWYKLARAGAFKMIRDRHTRLWRAFRPWDRGDQARAAEARRAPPLIPPRWIAEIGWENKKENFPSLVRLKTGWELLFFSSEGKPPNGVDVDGVWFDEEIVDPEWYSEMSARLLDRQGRFLWSATPQNATQQLYDLHCRAEEGDERVREFHIRLAANPHITEQAKADFAAKLSEEERRVRIDGEYALASYKVYPEYDKGVHNVPYFQIPEHWTRLAAVDPGRQVCAVLFAALPPKGDAVYFYREGYLRSADAEMFGALMSEACEGHEFLVFLIDGHAARQGEIGSGKTVEYQYARQLRRRKIRCRRAGFGFVHGADDPKAGILAFRSWLRIAPDGKPRLRVLEGACPNFEWEIGRYHYRRVRGLATDEAEKRNDHLMDCARYLAAYDPHYVPPAPRRRGPSGAVKAYRDKMERLRRKEGGGGHVTLGPGGGFYGNR